MAWTDMQVLALLQIASKGRIAREDRARLPAMLAAQPDALLLTYGQMVLDLQGSCLLSVAQCAALLTLTAACERFWRLGAAPAPLPGHLCEDCFDAPAVLLAPAPWGGDMGICAACQAHTAATQRIAT